MDTADLSIPIATLSQVTNLPFIRTRISCHTAPDTAARAAFLKESRMKVANANKVDRKSGGPAPGFLFIGFSYKLESPI